MHREISSTLEYLNPNTKKLYESLNTAIVPIDHTRKIMPFKCVELEYFTFTLPCAISIGAKIRLECNNWTYDHDKCISFTLLSTENCPPGTCFVYNGLPKKKVHLDNHFDIINEYTLPSITVHHNNDKLSILLDNNFGFKFNFVV